MEKKKNEERIGARPHVVMVPLIAQGHLIPFMELSKLLCSSGLAVSFITTPRNANRIRPQLQSLPINVVPLRMPPIDGLYDDAETSDNVSREQLEAIIVSFNRLSQPFDNWLASQILSASSARPVCVITDMFADWTRACCTKFGLPTIVFFTTGALLYCKPRPA